MKILMVASESNPFAKTGGLADVVFALSRELAIEGQEVAIVLPFYNLLRRDERYPRQQIACLNIEVGWRRQQACIYQTFVDGITFYFIENDFYFGREGLYGYHDDTERFAFFSIAVTQMMKAINFKPDVIHIHDWQPGMIPVIIKEAYRHDNFYNKIKFVLTIHNPAFQGLFDRSLLRDLFNLPDELFHSGKVRLHDQVSSLKSAIVYSDKLTTVSPTHAKELLTKEGSKGLSDVIRFREDDFSGILNGIDYAEFNPKEDSLITQNFDGRSISKRKAQNKAALLEKLHLSPGNGPLFGIVTRLTWQKGIDLFLAGARLVLEQGGYVVALGSGEYNLEQQLEGLRSEYPNRMAIYIGYNNKLAHEIYASSDYFFMPSLFEPCGIGQMIALRYATLPLVRYTGGLIDTVTGYDGENAKVANGFGFYDYSEQAIRGTTAAALDVYNDKKLFRQLQRNAYRANNNWSTSAKSYFELYKKVVG